MPIFEGSFEDKALERFWEAPKVKHVKGLKVENINRLKEILDYINTIDKLPPSPRMYRAHVWQGKSQTWSFDITGNMRVLCEFDEDIDPINIRIDDPH